MSFLIKDEKCLKNYESIQDKINILKKEFVKNPVYGKKYLNTKIKSFACKIMTDS